MPPPNTETDLAGFMTPFSDRYYDQETAQLPPTNAPETYTIYDKMSLTLREAARAIARFNRTRKILPADSAAHGYPCRSTSPPFRRSRL